LKDVHYLVGRELVTALFLGFFPAVTSLRFACGADPLFPDIPLSVLVRKSGLIRDVKQRNHFDASVIYNANTHGGPRSRVLYCLEKLGVEGSDKRCCDSAEECPSHSIRIHLAICADTEAGWGSGHQNLLI